MAGAVSDIDQGRSALSIVLCTGRQIGKDAVMLLAKHMRSDAPLVGANACEDMTFEARVDALVTSVSRSSCRLTPCG